MTAPRFALMPGTWRLGGGNNYPANWRSVTHGWRWYRVQGGKLLSPLQGYPLELPRNGFLPGAYFIPNAYRVWPMVRMLRDKRWYDFALTFGSVSGPLQRDFQMPRIGSMSATEYQARIILSDGKTGLEDSYDLPVIQQEITLALLQHTETTVATPANTS